VTVTTIERFHVTSKSRENHAIRHFGVQFTMVLCVVIGCSKRSGRDRDVSFYRIPRIISHRGQRDYELSKKRRNGFLAAISRDDLTEKVLQNDRICSRHFISGKPAALYDDTNPDWLPSLHLGHLKLQTSKKSSERWERRLARTSKWVGHNASDQNAAETLLTLSSSGIPPSVCEQDQGPTVELDGVATQTDITSASIDAMTKELDRCNDMIRNLTGKLT